MPLKEEKPCSLLNSHLSFAVYSSAGQVQLAALQVFPCRGDKFGEGCGECVMNIFLILVIEMKRDGY